MTLILYTMYIHEASHNIVIHTPVQRYVYHVPCELEEDLGVAAMTHDRVITFCYCTS